MKHQRNNRAAVRCLQAAFVICTAGILLGWLGTSARAGTIGNDGSRAVPGWVFPLNPPDPAAPAALDRIRLIHLPGSKVTFTQAQLNDLFAAPDWYPDSHSVMPEVVSHGNPPDVYACGYCHSPGGQGRPENASLAGLPAQYIVEQLADFKSGARRSAWSGPYRPADRMIDVARHATADEITAAARYFSAQQLRPRVSVIERSSIPRTHVLGWVYVADKGHTEEPLGERLLELAPDAERHEHRDDAMLYIAYAPPGSIGRGNLIAHSPATPCAVCHGGDLRGIGLIPPIAGRSPTYILRQLLAFKTGARAGTAGQPMRSVVTNLDIGNMIDVAAYAASLQP
jgi:cytochrome c553